MSSPNASESFQETLRDLIVRYEEEWGMSPPEIIGCLEVVKISYIHRVEL